MSLASFKLLNCGASIGAMYCFVDSLIVSLEQLYGFIGGRAGGDVMNEVWFSELFEYEVLLDEVDEALLEELDDIFEEFLFDAGELAHDEEAEEIVFCSIESFELSMLLFAMRSTISFELKLSIKLCCVCCDWLYMLPFESYPKLKFKLPLIQSN